MAPSEREAPPAPRRLRSRLQSIHYGCRDIARYRLEPLDGHAFPAVEAGAHIDVHLPNGLTRQYSLLPRSGPQGYVVAVKRDAASRGGSSWMHDQARVGMELELSAPRNHFALRADNGHRAPVLLLAGGIGITPIYAMMRALQEQGRDFVLHYWGRSPQQMLFADRLREDARVRLHARSLGGMPSVSSVVSGSLPESDVYACGPRTMLDELAAMGAGQRQGRIYMERFAPIQDACAMPEEGNADGFELVLARAGMSLAIAPGETILEVLKARGLDVMYSCEQGVCGACEVTCLEGQALHLDTVRTADEHEAGKTMIICCSRSKGPRLVLDI